ncbi:hypothetical protein Y032_0289g1492 [Ancylostoma ceylanicum]|uniref:Uncharacterized protein n=1 Tax=Ancylostoma ceylanicum TaxID=53326 RepID=A0A016S6G9_9BILA|nr:hypothetical protein Y032_0289g1492 [Ancylostoma ceylanicum]
MGESELTQLDRKLWEMEQRLESVAKAGTSRKDEKEEEDDEVEVVEAPTKKKKTKNLKYVGKEIEEEGVVATPPIKKKRKPLTVSTTD